MMPTRENIESWLMNNWSYSTGVPGIKGKTYEECKALWKVSKIKLLNKIKFDLDACECVNGNDFAMRTWAIISRQLASAKLLAPCGPFAIWRAMYRKASMKVQQEMNLEPKELKAVLGGAVQASGAGEVFE